MPQTLYPGVEELKWKEARKYMVHGCRELYKIFEEIDPTDQYTFIRICYPYGSLIMHNDELYIPYDGNLTISLNSPEIPQTLRAKLSYQSIPFGIITKNPIEIFREVGEHVLSIALSGPNKGIELGIFEYFGLTTCYSVTAGARSLFFVPKISKTRHHKKVTKHFHAKCIQPTNVFKQWYVFKELYNSEFFTTKWETEMIFLTKAWSDGLQKNKKSVAWEKLQAYLYKKCVEHSEFSRRKLILDIAGVTSDPGFKPDSYIIDTLKHLIHIFLGSVVGMRPVINDYAGPINEIQKIYLEHYRLTQIPTMLYSYRFSFEENIPVYYSMQVPTIIQANPSFRKAQTIIEDIRELIMLKPTIVRSYGNIKINGALLHNLVRLMKLEYYHADLYSYGKDIRPTNEIPLYDKDFLYCPFAANKSLKFAENGSYIRGCIKISRHENK